MHSNMSRRYWGVYTLLLALVAAVVVLSWSGAADLASIDYIDGALLQASVAFASARALNALISVLQSTTLSFSLFGGVAVTLGELLDPFNDLIEQYGTLMQWAIGSLLTQKILLGVVSHTLFKWLVTLSAILLAISLWWRQGRWVAGCFRLFLALLFLRFVLVAVVLLNGVVDHYFLDDQTRQQVAQLDNLPGQVKTLGGDATVLDNQPMLTALQERQRALERQRDQLHAEQQRLARALDQSRRALAELEQSLGGMARLIPFSRSENHTALLKQVDDMEAQQGKLERQLKPVMQQLADIARERAAVQQAKTDSETAAIALGEQFARAADPQTYLAIKQTLDDAVDAVLRAMTLFVLRTLILPLLFLYFLIKGLRFIWRIDWQPWFTAKCDRQAVVNQA